MNTSTRNSVHTSVKSRRSSIVSRYLLQSLIAVTVAATIPGHVKAQQAPPSPPADGGGISRETRYPIIESGKWTGRRTPDGQPDVSGHWSNTIANHNNFTDPQGGTPGERAGRAQGKREDRAPSRVTDPVDGQVPFQPWALAKVKDFQAHFNNPTAPQYIEPLARCAPAGVPKSFYWHGYEVAQYPGYVVFFFNSGTRLIHLDGKPHLDNGIKLWNGDSRGHWEGNTLVVDVTNVNGKALFGRTGEFASENAHYAERYIFSNDGKRYNYQVVITDPTVYTRPFTVTIPATRWTESDKPNGWHYEARIAKHDGKGVIVEREERICTENNGGFGNVSAG